MDEDAYDMAATYANVEELIAMKKYRGKDGKVDMCRGMKEWLEEERQGGRQEGLQAGLQALIETCQEVGKTPEEAASKVLQKFEMTEDEARECIKKYWK